MPRHKGWKHNIGECATACDDLGASCSGFAFKSNSTGGYCYLKDGTATNSDLKSAGSSTIDVGLVTRNFSSEDDCKSLPQPFEAGGGGGSKRFTVACRKTIHLVGNTTTASAPSMRDCLGQCADQNLCKGVIYDAFLSDGSENCWMMANGDPDMFDTDRAGSVDSAILADEPAGSAPANTGAIAGGVVGGVAFVAIAAGLLFFLVRRRRRRPAQEPEAEAPAAQDAPVGRKEVLETPVSALASTSPGVESVQRSELTSGSHPASELDSRRPPAEMAGTAAQGALAPPAELPGSVRDRL